MFNYLILYYIYDSYIIFILNYITKLTTYSIFTWRTVSEYGDTGGVNMRWKRLVQIRLFFKHRRQHHGGHSGATVTHTHAQWLDTTQHFTRLPEVCSSLEAHTCEPPRAITITQTTLSPVSRSNLAAPFLDLKTGHTSTHRNSIKTGKI